MEAAPDIAAFDEPAHAFAVPVAGLTTGALLHRSKHADTVRGFWRGIPVVAKRVREDIADPVERDAAARGIVREGMLLQRVEHPAIVRVLELVTEPATLILELVPGRSMRDELKLRRRMAAGEAASVASQLATALDHLHRRHILHRDVKPANIIYDGERAVLIDFHLAKEPGAMRGGAGTRLFAAPEQVLGGHVTTAADIWGLGTVLYRATTGRLPFHAEEGHPQLTARPVPALQRLADSRFGGDVERAARELPPELADLIDRMLAHEPADRPTTEQIIRTCAQRAGGTAS